MRRFVDLHTHSTASDGSVSPEELIAMADSLRLAAIALTDHDTTAGLAEAHLAAEQTPKLCFIAGIELSARCERGTMHILGLGIDANAESLQELLRQLRQARRQRNPKIIEKLRSLGFEITMEDVRSTAGGAKRRDVEIISRLHIAETMRQKGFARTIDDAFKRFLAIENTFQL